MTEGLGCFFVVIGGVIVLLAYSLAITLIGWWGTAAWCVFAGVVVATGILAREVER